jgi:hypothetical protein
MSSTHLELAAHDGLHLGVAVGILVLAGLGHELEGAEHVAMVGDGHCGHAVGDGLFESAGMLLAPSRRENWVWTCRWEKDIWHG